MKKLILILLFLSAFLSGCGKAEEVAVISRICVLQEEGGCEQIYTSSDKMQRVLNGLRQLGQRFRPEVDPMALDAPETCITLEFSDGGRSCYLIKGDRYIREDQRQWQQTDPDKLGQLQFLIKALPGDLTGSCTDSAQTSGADD